MRILFVISEHPKYSFNAIGTFFYDYIIELRKYCDVRTVYFSLREEKSVFPDEIIDYVINPGKKIDIFDFNSRIFEISSHFRELLEPVLNSFKPDVIHCNSQETYMAFRFDENVFYSSYSMNENFVFNENLNNFYFQNRKFNRFSVGKCSIVGVYSDLAFKKVFNASNGLCSSVVLPLGVNFERFSRMNLKSKNVNGFDEKNQRLAGSCKNKKICISYFGRFDDVQSGINDFVFAVNNLGKRFKEKYDVEYSMYGSGELCKLVDYSLIDNIKFAVCDEIIEACEKSDIVVMPGRYESFGFMGLLAMAFGCLLIVSAEFGMDDYAKPEFNCLEIPKETCGIVKVLDRAIEKIDSLKIIRENARKTAMDWNLTRCVKSHLYFYRLICEKRFKNVFDAYQIEFISILESYRNVSDVEKIYRSEMERKACIFIYENFCLNNLISREFKENQKFLFVTGSYLPDECELPKNVKTISVLTEGEDGVVIRPECIPFKDETFDVVVAVGSWESVISPSSALLELQRVSKGNVMILEHNGFVHNWQLFKMEKSDWKKLITKGWNCDFSLFNYGQENDEIGDFRIIRYLKNAEVKKAENFA